jgi:hypothetical protein
MLTFLPAIDSAFARSQYEIYRDLFVDERMGLPGIREYPPGVTGWGDIDSGPVIWEIGGAASVVGLGTSAVYGDSVLHHGLNGAVEGFGMGWSFGTQKTYLFGSLPIADAFIAWSLSHRPLTAKWSGPIYWKFHFISLGLFLMFGVLLWLVWRKRKGAPLKTDHYANY